MTTGNSKSRKPPKTAQWILKTFIFSEEKRTVVNDLNELFTVSLRNKSGFYSKLWYWLQTLKILMHFSNYNLTWNLAMFKNYITVAMRNLKKQKIYSFINIFGLAVGLCVVILILLYVQYELSFDNFHDKADRIYRVVYPSQGKSKGLAVTPSPVATALNNEFPGIVNSVTFGQDPVLLRYNENSFREEKFYWTDETVFEIFSFQLIKGNPKTALSNPNSIVITDKIAEKYFGDENPINKEMTVKIYDGNRKLPMIVTGVVKTPPENSHFKFDVLGAIKAVKQIYKRFENNWGFQWLYTYILLPEAVSWKEIESQLPYVLDKYAGEGTSEKIELVLQPLKDIHLKSNLDFEAESNGSITFVYIFSFIALFILVIACINYMNLTIARSSKRAKEIGIRKVVGANRRQIAKQLFGEFLLSTIFAIAIGIVLVKFFLPTFSDLAARELSFNLFSSPVLLFSLIGITFLVSVISSLYPIILVSSFRPVDVLKGYIKIDKKGFSLRNKLVILQFTVSVILIISTLVVYSQLNFIRNRNLGFNKEQVLLIPIVDRNVQAKIDILKSEFQKNPGVKRTAVSSAQFPSFNTYMARVRWEGLPADETPNMKIITVDENFFEMLEIKFVEGRNFSKDFTTDETSAFIINEAALNRIGWDSAIGKDFRVGQREGKIIGVIRNYHEKSLHSRIEPIVYFMLSGIHRFSPDNVLLKVDPVDIPATLGILENIWEEFSPEQPFSYYFIDESYAQQYKAEERFGKVFRYSSIFAIVIACLGLFGLASYMAELRSKEIGIRKVLGASVSEIYILLFREFIKWVFIAILIGIPVAYLAMNKWLENFAFRINIGIWIFILAGTLAVVIALTSVSYQSLKAAYANPVDSLRNE